jgi:ferredoxin-NADP reductase
MSLPKTRLLEKIEVAEGTMSFHFEKPAGYIDTDMLARYVPDRAAPIYYLCGPAGMVTAMRTMLGGVGADEYDIRTEDFTGYCSRRSRLGNLAG